MAGGTYENTALMGFDQADTTITDTGLRVKISGDHGVTLAGIYDDEIGISYQPGSLAGWGTSGDRCSVAIINKQGSFFVKASGVISQNAQVYRAASGKISATAAGNPIGFALEAAADGDIIEVILYGRRAQYKVTDPGTGAAIPVQNGDMDVEITIGSSGAETNTLAVPKYVGQKIRIFTDTCGSGTRAVTVASAFNVSGNTVITFDAARDWVELFGVTVGGTLAWQIGASANVALS